MAKGSRAVVADTVGNKQDDSIPLVKKLAQAGGRGRRPAEKNAATAVKEPIVLNGAAGTGSHASDLNGINGTNGAIAGHAQPTSTSSVSPWSQTDREILLLYRSAHRLRAPATFANPHGHQILCHGIGRSSPSMSRPKHKQRVAKEHLAMAVKKHFNALAVNENESIVHTLYKAKLNDKPLRMKFLATKPK